LKTAEKEKDDERELLNDEREFPENVRERKFKQVIVISENSERLSKAFV
jgi:hypothetical protein